MAQLVLVRHGQSVWNLENRFTGWRDVELSPLGEQEAARAGEVLRGTQFAAAFTSALVRAQHTLAIILDVIGQPDLPVTRDAALNERNYGDLQGLNKAEMIARYGAEQVNRWRRGYRDTPPGGESLANTHARVVPYYTAHIAPLLTGAASVLVVAHGNSLRALVMHLNHLSETAVEALEIPTGVPSLFTLP